MLTKKKRLNRETFNRFFSAGKRYHSPSLMLIYHAHNAFQASAVAPKKFAKTAVLRNKFRRRVYEVLKGFEKENQNTGVYIVIAKEKAALLPFDTLREELHALVKKVLG